VLYNTTTICELKKCFEIYDRIKETGFKEFSAIDCIAIEEVEVAELYRSKVEAMIAAHPKDNGKTLEETKIDAERSNTRLPLTP